MENSFPGSLEISFLLLFPLLRNTLNYQGHQEIMDKVTKEPMPSLQARGEGSLRGIVQRDFPEVSLASKYTSQCSSPACNM